MQINPALSRNLFAKFDKINQRYVKDQKQQPNPHGAADFPVITLSSSDDDADEFYGGNEGDLFGLAASSNVTSDSEIEIEAERSFKIDDDEIDELR